MRMNQLLKATIKSKVSAKLVLTKFRQFKHSLAVPAEILQPESCAAPIITLHASGQRRDLCLYETRMTIPLIGVSSLPPLSLHNIRIYLLSFPSVRIKHAVTQSSKISFILILSSIQKLSYWTVDFWYQMQNQKWFLLCGLQLLNLSIMRSCD